MAHIQLRSGKPEDMCCPELQALYMSLLGAIAYLTHTRIDIVVFICAFQRWTHKPSVQHARKLNKLLTWIQKNPRKLAYRRFGPAEAKAVPHTHLRVISDAAYKRETEDGYSLRGALFLRAAGTGDRCFSKEETPVHLIDVVCRSQKRVTRSTFAAELLAAGEAADQGLLTSHMLYETEYGALSAAEARQRRS